MVCIFQGLSFETIPSTYEEDLNPSSFSDHGEYAVATACLKVQEVDLRLADDPIKPDIIIGADTVVSLEGKPYGKPKDKDEAFRYLQE